MDTNQLLIIIIITITTILMTIVGIQLIFLLKELRKTIKKIGDDFDILKEEVKEKNDHQEKKLNNKKYLTIHSLLNKISFFSPKSPAKTKKLFVKDKKYI